MVPVPARKVNDPRFAGVAQTIRPRDGSAMIAMSFRHSDPLPTGDDLPGQHALIRERLGGIGGEVPHMLERMADGRGLRAPQPR